MEHATEQRFATTHWSVVVTAAELDSGAAAGALEKLCRSYWFPLYAYLRRKGQSPHDAEDLTQAFFAFLLEKGALASVDRRKGKFRSFLLAALNHFVSDQRDYANAYKRGGGRTIISFDAVPPEERYRVEPADPLTPIELFEREWALAVLDQARERLRAEFAAAGKAALFDQLKLFEAGAAAGATYAELATQLGTTESAIKSAVPRMRQRYRELVREEVAQTVLDRAEISAEVKHLMRAVGR